MQQPRSSSSSVPLDSSLIHPSSTTSTRNQLTDFRSVCSFPHPHLQLSGPSLSRLPQTLPQEGEVFVSGACVSSGYFEDPVGTAAAFGVRGFRSGDLGRWERSQRSGRTLMVLGRPMEFSDPFWIRNQACSVTGANGTCFYLIWFSMDISMVLVLSSAPYGRIPIPEFFIIGARPDARCNQLVKLRGQRVELNSVQLALTSLELAQLAQLAAPSPEGCSPELWGSPKLLGFSGRLSNRTQQWWRCAVNNKAMGGFEERHRV